MRLGLTAAPEMASTIEERKPDVPDRDPAPRYSSDVISDFIVDQVADNETGIVLVPVAVGSGKTYAIADAVARRLAAGDTRRVFFITPNRNPRGDFRETLLKACARRGVSLAAGDVVMAESWEDTVKGLLRPKTGQGGAVHVDLTRYAALEDVIGSLPARDAKKKSGAKSKKLPESPLAGRYAVLTKASIARVAAAYKCYRDFLLDSKQQLGYLYSTDKVMRDFADGYVKEATGLLRDFRRTVGRCFWSDLGAFAKRLDKDAGGDIERLFKSALSEKSSGWAWLDSAFPEVRYLDARVIVLTNKKAFFGVDTVVSGKIEPYSSEGCVLYIDESDATKKDTLTALIEQGIASPIDFIRYCEGLNKRLASCIECSSDIFDGPLDGYRERWLAFCERLSDLCEAECFNFSLKRVEESETAPLFFSPDIGGIGARGKGPYHLVPDTSANKSWIKSKHDASDEERRNLDVAVRKARSIFTSMATLAYDHGRALAAVWNGRVSGKKGSGFVARQLQSRGVDNAVMTVARELKLADDDVSPFDIIDNAFSVRHRGNGAVVDTGLPSAGGWGDLTVYAKGCSMQRLKDDLRHDTFTNVLNFSVDASPESILVDAARRNLVVLASGTAVVDQIGNYDFEYVERGLDSLIVLPTGKTAEELGRLADMRDAGAEHYAIDVEIAPFPMDSPFDVAAWSALAPECEEFSADVMRYLLVPAKFIIDSNDDPKTYAWVAQKLRRYFNVLYSFKTFAFKPLCKSFICITNAGVDASAAADGDLFEKCGSKYSAKVLSSLMEHVAKGALPEGGDARAWVEETFMRADSAGLKHTMARARKRLESGGEAFLMLTYSAGSKALNLQYEIPKGVEVYPVPGMYPSTKKDWDGIYLESPTNKASDGGGDGDESAIFQKLMGVYETLELEDRGDLSRSKGEKRIRSILGDTKYVEKWKFPSVRRAASVDVNQALGRIDRTGNKADVTIIADMELLEHVDADAMESPYVTYNYTTPAWKALARCLSEGLAAHPDIERKRNEEALTWEAAAHDAQARAVAYSDRLKPSVVYGGDGGRKEISSWSWVTPRRLEAYRELGEFLLAHPRGSKEDFVGGNKIMDKLMVPGCDGLDRYFFRTEGDFDKTELSRDPFSKPLVPGCHEGVVSMERARLPLLPTVDGLAATLSEAGVALDWGDGDYMMSPILFRNYYLGRLGEIVFACWWKLHMESATGALSDLPYETFETFDFLDVGTGTYIDVKDFAEDTRIGDDGYYANVCAKARFVGARRVVFANVFSPKGTEFLPKRSDREGIEILEIPHIITDTGRGSAFWTSRVRDAYLGFVDGD